MAPRKKVEENEEKTTPEVAAIEGAPQEEASANQDPAKAAAQAPEHDLERKEENHEEPKDGAGDALPTQEEVNEAHSDEPQMVQDAYALRDESVERLEKPFSASNLYAQRAVLDTSGIGEASNDIRRAYPTFDVEALVNEDVPEHLAKYITSEAGAPAILKREEDARADDEPSKE